jgi:flagellar hook-associated protein 2
MGTVGISFGSPTSGAGFDVSTTVAQIVGNLQNVETPWKTQLTSLEAQDTTISSLGTLFSNLSNDMSSLTDLEGILAEKTGSSSDTNVVEVTAATASALAGTHTVEVTNLAATSSGYLAAVKSASTTLTGSVTLQAGSGKAQTFAITSADNTLSTLAATINASAVGITASLLTDSSGSRLSLVSSTSGALGNIAVSANTIGGTGQILGYTGTAGATGVASTGTLAGIETAGDTLSGSISIQVGTGAATTIAVGTSSNTLATLATAINTAGLGVTASVVTANGVSSLSLLSGATGTAGNLTVSSSVVDTKASTLAYTNTTTGEDANLTVDGSNLTSASNTVANLIPGITLQLLAPSSTGEQVQVVIGNDNTNVESTVNQFVTDYNSLVSAMNTQDGNTTSGTPEPLFGSPTLSLLQQQLLGGLNIQNPNGALDSIPTNAGTVLTGSINIAVGTGTTQNFVVGSGTNDPATNTYYTGSASGYNTLSGLAAAINAANSSSSVTYADAGTTSTTAPDSGTLIASSSSLLSGSISIAVGTGTTETIVFGSQPSTGAASDTLYTATSNMTLSGLATFIQSANLGVTAAAVTTSGTTTLTLTSATDNTAGALTVSSSIVAAGLGITASVQTSGTEASLALLSQTAGSTGAISTTSSIVATSDAVMSYSGMNGINATTTTGATYATGAITAIPSAGDTLSGSLTIEAGTGATTQFNLSSLTDKTLTGLSNAINNAKIGITASIVTANGASSLSLVSQTAGTAGNLTAVSTLLDTTDTSTKTLNYTNSSDVDSLTGLGISVNNDGSITFDAASLDSVLNSDYSSVVGFFQNVDSWGQNFSTMLTNAGTSSATGIISLASSSNSNIESTLNADISKENTYISAQQVSLTAELNSANEIMQELPSQLNGVNELYSAVTGYNQNQGG